MTVYDAMIHHKEYLNSVLFAYYPAMAMVWFLIHWLVMINKCEPVYTSKADVFFGSLVLSFCNSVFCGAVYTFILYLILI